MKDTHGNRVPMTQKTDALAEYLYEKHWAPNVDSSPVESRSNLLPVDLPFNTADFSDSEVIAAIRKMNTNKAPGPDGCISEWFKFLDLYNIHVLTTYSNNLWRTKRTPDSFARAHVASLYQKGDHDNRENYHPISLLNTTYKIFAHILKQRLADVLETRIGQTQFGFRKGKSTIEPIFCVRRLTDLVEQANDPLWMIFLDWEKSFW